MSGARQGWNAAKLASERELKKPRKLMDPVIPTGATESMLRWNGDRACKACGFDVHAPTCPTQRPTLKQFPTPEQLEANRLLTIDEAVSACLEGKVVAWAVYLDGQPVAPRDDRTFVWNEQQDRFEYGDGRRTNFPFGLLGPRRAADHPARFRVVS